MRCWTIEQIKARIRSAVPGARVEIVPNDSPVRAAFAAGRQRARARRREVSCATIPSCGSITLQRHRRRLARAVIKTKIKVKKVVDGVEKEVEETTETKRPGYLEVVYHLYSMALKHGPLILRLRTGNRTDQNHVPSLTPSGAAANSRNARSTISTASSSTAIRTCAAS